MHEHFSCSLIGKAPSEMEIVGSNPVSYIYNCVMSLEEDGRMITKPWERNPS